MAFPTINGTAATTTSAAATSIVANMPSGIAVGELLIAIVSCVLAQTQTGPAGWRLAISEFSDGFSESSIEVYKRIADGTEGSTQTFNFGGSCASTAMVFRVSGFDPYTEHGVTGTNSGTTGSTTAMTCPTVTPNTTDNLVIRTCATRQSTSISDPGGYTALANASTGTGATDCATRCASTTQAGSGATGTAAFVGAGTDRAWVAATIAIKSPATPPAAVTPPTFLLRA